MNNTQIRATIVLFLGLLCAVTFMVTHTWADEPKPSAEDRANLQDIIANQKIIEENRPAHEKFVAAKTWNTSEVDALAKEGWCPKWAEDPDDITLIPCSFPTGEQ